jgi:hypothetical protein
MVSNSLTILREASFFSTAPAWTPARENRWSD